jgi:hypothetical protein
VQPPLFWRLFAVVRFTTATMQTFPAMAIQSSGSSASEIGRAASVHFWLFVAYFGVLVLAALLTWAVWHSGNRLQDAIRADAEAKIADANAAAELARKEAAVARENTARTELELERLKRQVGPRQLNREAFLKALEGQAKAPVQILYLRDDADSLEFAQEIDNLLRRAGWTVTARDPIPTPPAARSGQEIPVAMSVGGQPSGVTVVTNFVSEEESKARSDAIMGRAWLKTPWTVLMEAFAQSMGAVRGSGNRTCPEGMLRVIVAPRR